MTDPTGLWQTVVPLTIEFITQYVLKNGQRPSLWSDSDDTELFIYGNIASCPTMFSKPLLESGYRNKARSRSASQKGPRYASPQSMWKVNWRLNDTWSKLVFWIRYNGIDYRSQWIESFWWGFHQVNSCLYAGLSRTHYIEYTLLDCVWRYYGS